MDSGNKAHVWHALKEYADIEVIENLRKRISQTIWNYCGFNTDTSLHSATNQQDLQVQSTPRAVEDQLLFMEQVILIQ